MPQFSRGLNCSIMHLMDARPHEPFRPADLARLQCEGYLIVPAATPPTQLARLLEVLTPQLAEQTSSRPATLRSRGVVVAARHVLDQCPEMVRLWHSPPLVSLLGQVLGPRCGLVRALFFDKPPQRTWGLPWHRDRTIAVRRHLPEVAPFAKPTIKAGVPHLEAPLWLLQQMLTLRLHLDGVDRENGALQVIPGSHAMDEGGNPLGEIAQRIVSIDVRAGDCLAMRPLISHASGASAAGTIRHRRVLHLEFAAEEHLPAGYAWRDFQRVSEARPSVALANHDRLSL
jgi:hypothetical protein